MASHVVVIDATARRTPIKVTPNRHLSDVLQEACGKLSLDASKYGLKHNNKPVDLSRSIRLSGLSSGAKLELVQLSRSPGVVSVALQLPESEAQGPAGSRLTDKFPSTTTLWLVLRKFEAGVAGSGGTKRNLTARGIPSMKAGATGAGRLFYQQPVLQIMSRELSTFADLQKSLAQLGFNNGSVLVRLSFKASETPLEDAMTQIGEYFQSVDGSPDVTAAPATGPAASALASAPPESEKGISEEEFLRRTEGIPSAPSAEGPTPSEDQPLSSEDTSDRRLSPSEAHTSRPVSVYRPPTSSTPSAALTQHNESDYTPTVEHAQRHQRNLSLASRPTRLPTDAELASQAAEEQSKLAAIRSVEIKIRFPDESAVSASFGQTDSGADLYGFVRECLEQRWRGERFLLRHPRGSSRRSSITGIGMSKPASMGLSRTHSKDASLEVVPDDEAKKLIVDLGIKGRVLVMFQWDDRDGGAVAQGTGAATGAAAAGASPASRGAKTVLKPELRARAVEMKPPVVPELNQSDDDDDGGGGAAATGRRVKATLGAGRMDTEGRGGGADGDRDGDGMGKKLPKWLKGLSKK